MHTSRINCYFCSLAVKDGVLAGSPCMMPMVPLRLRVCRIHYWNSARLCCLQLVSLCEEYAISENGSNSVLPQFRWKFPPQFFERILEIAWVRWFTTGLFFAFISSFHFYAFLPVRFPWDLLHLCRWGSVGVHPETVLFPPPTSAGGGHARDPHVGSERVPLAQRCLGRLGGAPWKSSAAWMRGLLFPVQASAKCCVQRCKGIPGLEVAAEPEGSMHLGWRENGHQIGHGTWGWVIRNIYIYMYTCIYICIFIYIFTYICIMNICRCPSADASQYPQSCPHSEVFDGTFAAWRAGYRDGWCWLCWKALGGGVAWHCDHGGFALASSLSCLD